MSEQPKRGSEWFVRYRVRGQSRVWPNMVVCEIVSGPYAGKTKVLDVEAFGLSGNLERGRRTKRAVAGRSAERRRNVSGERETLIRSLTFPSVRRAYRRGGFRPALRALAGEGFQGEIHVGNHSNCGDDAMGREGPCRACDAETLLRLELLSPARPPVAAAGEEREAR